MKPKKFYGCNVIYGKSQPGVLPLPAHKAEDGYDLLEAIPR